jgi:hypothetical protein
VIKANQVMPAVVAEVIRKAPLTGEKVSFAWRLAVGPAVDKATAVRLSVGLIRSRLAHYLGENAIKRIAYEEN